MYKHNLNLRGLRALAGVRRWKQLIIDYGMDARIFRARKICLCLYCFDVTVVCGASASQGVGNKFEQVPA